MQIPGDDHEEGKKEERKEEKDEQVMILPTAFRYNVHKLP